MTSSAAPSASARPDAPEELQVELRDPRLAAFLAWLLPGLGHFYQGRIHKGILFFVCILGVYSYGMYLGGGKVVYASMRTGDRRLPYLCQVGVGLPALPAMVQAYRTGKRPPPAPLWGGFMAPPRMPGADHADDRGELVDWQMRLHVYFELGTVYTMIAGLLNVLAIYDAYAGPLLIIPTRKPDRDKPPDSADGASKSDTQQNEAAT